MKNHFKILIIFIFLINIGFSAFAEGENKNPAPAKSISTITGKVCDLKTGETLAGVAVCIEGTTNLVYTDLDGFYTLELMEPGEYNLVFSLISYKNSLAEKIRVNSGNQEVLDIKLDNK